VLILLYKVLTEYEVAPLGTSDALHEQLAYSGVLPERLPLRALPLTLRATRLPPRLPLTIIFSKKKKVSFYGFSFLPGNFLKKSSLTREIFLEEFGNFSKFHIFY